MLGPRGLEPGQPYDAAADLLPANRALEACVALTALAPQASVEAFVGAGLGIMAAAVGGTGGFVALGKRSCPPSGDPLYGWRLEVFYAVGTGPHELEAVETELRAETYVHDAIVQGVVRDAGRHRVYHDPDPRTVKERAGSLDEKYWNLLGLRDRLKLVYALAPNVEIHFGINRVGDAPRFERRDVLALEGIARGLGPWSQRLALLHGYLARRQPLSPRERAMACRLLGPAPTKLIADDLRLSEARARELTRDVYRKLRIRSRPELASAWLALAPAVPPLTLATTRPRRRMPEVRRQPGPGQ